MASSEAERGGEREGIAREVVGEVRVGSGEREKVRYERKREGIVLDIERKRREEEER